MTNKYYEKVLKGCGKKTIGYSNTGLKYGIVHEIYCGDGFYCLECQAKLEALKEAWKEELEFLEKRYIGLFPVYEEDWFSVDEKKLWNERIKQLKDRLKK